LGKRILIEIEYSACEYPKGRLAAWGMLPNPLSTIPRNACEREGCLAPVSIAAMNYVIGDIQGCFDALHRLLEKIEFSPSRDRLFVLGDLCNRGPQTLATLQKLRSLGDAAQCVLGNHDLHLLAVACGARPAQASDTFSDVLQAPDREDWLQWLREQALAISDCGWLMVHAGVAPQWSLALTLQLAQEVQTQLRSPDWVQFMHAMYGARPTLWRAELTGDERLRFIVNALTRIRYVDAQGALNFQVKTAPNEAPAGLIPWFDAPGRLTAHVPVAFGHWSTLGLLNRPNLLATDTGCAWGGALTAIRIDEGRRDVVQVPSERDSK
jgi:bis(5'-nucleosyl)-tetraphosphatase (symmetrical)